ncbi:SLIT-ROBO Rho GTPase-activating protein 1-like isoform X1 [Artemia franciscana]|uniref:SLIT-ROBO Rho GTPase-activating protein 1-like isoform X1 n=1 Tax=Artemia franciscana TaxID=6661 RepID=UPI0032DACA42
MFQCFIQYRDPSIFDGVDMRDVFPEIRSQFTEQLKCLDSRVETQVAITLEIQEYYRRRAEVEVEYGRQLDKLARSLLMRHREQKQKRENWNLFSSFACWQQLITETKQEAKDHCALGDLYSSAVLQTLGLLSEDVQRIYKKCREISQETHEELLKVLHELQTGLKTRQTYATEWRAAVSKLKTAESQKAKLEASTPKEKLDKSKKYKVIEKEIQKRRNKFNDANVKGLKSRNEHALSLEASNAALHKYFVDDLPDIMDCMDFGFHTGIAKAIQVHLAAKEGLRRSSQHSSDQIATCINNLDSRTDKRKFIEGNHTAFVAPRKLEQPSPVSPDQEPGSNIDLTVNDDLKDELMSRANMLMRRLTSLRAESEEIWKTIETAEKSLVSMISDDELQKFTAHLFTEESNGRLPESLLPKLKPDRLETEDFYLVKFKEYILRSNRQYRLQAKLDLIRRSLGNEFSEMTVPASPLVVQGQQRPPRRRIGRTPRIGQPKLFGGSIEEYVEVTGKDIPLIVKSCIRVINLYGLQHQGIFRVSGSQVEINHFREAFERGDDPLADMTDASDINSVAGVLKLYLRELREPFFPLVFFDQFMALAQLESKEDFVNRMGEVIQSLPRAVFIVMRYIFHFLHHLSEYSDENMMDPHNLAVCFGPTLVPVPDDKEQVQYQNLVNVLIKNVILYAEEIFPNDGGTTYEKYFTKEPDETEVGEAPSEPSFDEADAETCPSEDETETLEAVAQFDFNARSSRELSFKKGHQLTLYSQVSSDWWRGCHAGKVGLVPDKYILLKFVKEEDRDRSLMPSLCETNLQVDNSANLRRRTSSSGDSIQSARSLTSIESGSTSIPLPSEVASTVSTDSNASPVFLRGVEPKQPPTVAWVRPTSIVEPQSPLPPRDSAIGSLSTPDRLSESEESTTTKEGLLEESPVIEEKTWRLSDQLQATVDLSFEQPCDSSDSASIGSSTESLETQIHAATEETKPPVAKGSFVRKRDLWERKLAESEPGPSKLERGRRVVDARPHIKTRSYAAAPTPDLVMDLPVISCLSSSPQTSSSSSVSSPSPTETAADTFAAQNQSTLKKSDAARRKGGTAEPIAAKTKTASTNANLAPRNPSDPHDLRTATIEPDSENNQPTSEFPLPRTPKLATKFPHFYNLPTPVLPTPGTQLVNFRAHLRSRSTSKTDEDSKE